MLQRAFKKFLKKKVGTRKDYYLFCVSLCRAHFAQLNDFMVMNLRHTHTEYIHYYTQIDVVGFGQNGFRVSGSFEQVGRIEKFLRSAIIMLLFRAVLLYFYAEIE